MTLKEKLKLIDPAIAWMIMENIKDWHKTRRVILYVLKDDNNITSAFYWHKAKHIADYDFWYGINSELYLMEEAK